MKILRSDLEITKNTLEELFKIYSDRFRIEVTSGCYVYDRDCPSYENIKV